jgi:hypothetical protein
MTFTISSLSKAQIRQILSVDGKGVSPTTFRRLCAQWQLAKAIGMDEDEFARRKNFWGEEARLLLKALGVDYE